MSKVYSSGKTKSMKRLPYIQIVTLNYDVREMLWEIDLYPTDDGDWEVRKVRKTINSWF
jgi:hypothetical protein